ncbi:hypothetical protein [Methylobacterium nodulans]|uniref:hypothetical protein n=1 Tax=Methylobacterium nodulans TaxID=114616 RepID=UPI0012ED5A47|nr:hypothetical protein [Methylobacterium nodulans]
MTERIEIAVPESNPAASGSRLDLDRAALRIGFRERLARLAIRIRATEGSSVADRRNHHGRVRIDIDDPALLGAGREKSPVATVFLHLPWA